MRTAGRDRSREKKKEIKKKNEAIVFRDDAGGGLWGRSVTVWFGAQATDGERFETLSGGSRKRK
jgi:hypothetical protein